MKSLVSYRKGRAFPHIRRQSRKTKNSEVLMEEFKIPKPPRTNYLNAEYGLKSWLLTKDHKRIAVLYLGGISFFFLIGSLYAMAIRLELLTPQGDLVQSSTYNKMFTQH